VRGVNFMRAHSQVEKFCGGIKKQLAENSLNNHFLPLANIFTGSPSPASYDSYTKKKEKERPHEGKGEKWLGYLIIKMLYYWSALANC
jgi:hypothetical protein